jgi:hypothetical protein
VKRLIAQGRAQVDGDGCYRIVDDAVEDAVADSGGGLTDTENSAAVEPKHFSEVPEVSPVVLREAMAEIAQLRAENEMLLNWITGESDALTCLQAIYQNSASSEHTRIKAASSAIAFERPKLSVAVSVRGSDILGQCLDDAKPMKVINPPETSD